MTASDMSNGFIIIGEPPELPPLQELEILVEKLDSHQQSLERWRDQECDLCDQNLYVRDDNFHEVDLLKQTRKCYFVRLPCGKTHCLPARRIDELGRYTRRTGTAVHAYWQGWRARQELLSLIKQTDGRYARVKSKVIPSVLREARKCGIAVPHELVQRLKSHYRTSL